MTLGNVKCFVRFFRNFLAPLENNSIKGLTEATECEKPPCIKCYALKNVRKYVRLGKF